MDEVAATFLAAAARSEAEWAGSAAAVGKVRSGSRSRSRGRVVSDILSGGAGFRGQRGRIRGSGGRRNCGGVQNSSGGGGRSRQRWPQIEAAVAVSREAASGEGPRTDQAASGCEWGSSVWMGGKERNPNPNPHLIPCYKWTLVYTSRPKAKCMYM